MYYVYRINLDPSVWDCPKFRKRNASVLLTHPQADRVEGFYIGSTALRVSRRVEQHMLGNPGMGGANMVRLYAAVHQDEPSYQVIAEYDTRRDAEAREAHEADRYRSRGYGVWTNVKLKR